MPLTIVAQLRARDGKADALAAALAALVPVTRGEPGCEAYELYRSIEDDSLFHFHEHWTDRAAWEAHMAAPHLTAFQATSDAIVAEFRLFQLERTA